VAMLERQALNGVAQSGLFLVGRQLPMSISRTGLCRRAGTCVGFRSRRATVTPSSLG
jgi:hypothetical protein